MANLYFNGQLIATSTITGILNPALIDTDIAITYKTDDKKYYSILMFDDTLIHSLMINIKGHDLTTGDILVDYIPYSVKNKNYDATVYIYEQPKKLKIPPDDFDMDEFIKNHSLNLLYKIEFLVLKNNK